MTPEAPVSREFFDQVTTDPAGYRDKRGEWRPANPIRYAPVFVRPVRLLEFARWLKGYLIGWNTIFFAIAALTWFYFQPPLETCRTFQPGWIAQVFARNMALLWIVFGGWHLYLYTFKRKGHRGKYSPRWQSRNGATFLFKNQIHDNIFWTCGSGCITWTAYEVVTLWMYANGRLPYIDFRTSPVWFVVLMLLVPFWREFHFYWIHRLIHWKPLYDRIHYLHHYNINPGPWSGLAMHPIEHLLYFSVTLIHWIVPSHPLHFLFNAQHTALTPAAGHTGFEGDLDRKLNFGSYFHYLHHRHFDCNYGESSIPLDRWFGSFDDGSRTDTEKNEARRAYRRYTVIRVTPESPDVKSFLLRRADGAPLEPWAPGQHLLFRIALPGGRNPTLRFYSLADHGPSDVYRIAVRRQAAPADPPGAPAGAVSSFLHDTLKEGDELEARGPLGDFTPDVSARKPLALVAGGIGITPILAMLKACLDRHPSRRIHLFLCFRDGRHELFRSEVEALARAHRSLVCHIFLSRARAEDLAGRAGVEPRRLDAATLTARLPHLDMDFYICGPNRMAADLLGGLREAGVPGARLHTETFTLDRAAAVPAAIGSAQHAVTFKRSNKTLIWDSEFRNLLEFAESNGIVMDAGCMFGECGACSAKLEQGEVAYNYTTASKPRPGHCLPCSCRPQSAITLDA